MHPAQSSAHGMPYCHPTCMIQTVIGFLPCPDMRSYFFRRPACKLQKLGTEANLCRQCSVRYSCYFGKQQHHELQTRVRCVQADLPREAVTEAEGVFRTGQYLVASVPYNKTLSTTYARHIPVVYQTGPHTCGCANTPSPPQAGSQTACLR